MTAFSPYDNPVTESKSDMTATNFGGRREHSQTGSSKDYTSRTNAAPDKIENPEGVVMDIDSMNDSSSLKSTTKRIEDLSNRRGTYDSSFIFMLDTTDLLLEELSNIRSPARSVQPDDTSYWNTPMFSTWEIPMSYWWDISMEEQ